MISDLVQLIQTVNSIKERIDKVFWNKEQCLYLLERVEILESALEPLLNISDEEKQVYKKAFEKLNSVLKNVERYVKNCENWYRIIRNTVFVNQHSEEITSLDKQITDAASTLDVALGSRNAENVSTLLRQISDITKIQQAIQLDTQAVLDAVKNSTYSEAREVASAEAPVQNINQLSTNTVLSTEEQKILSETLLAYRKAIDSQASVSEPLSYNPSRDILLATEAGKRLDGDEREQVYAFLHDGETQKLKQLIEKKNQECKTDIHKELKDYFERYYIGRERRINLSTLIERAVKQAADTNISKYVSYPESFFKGKILSLHNKRNDNATEQVKLEHIDAEIVGCTKINKEIELLVQDPLGQGFKINIAIWSDTLDVKVFALETREFGRYIKSFSGDTSETVKTIISLKPKGQNVDHYFVAGNYQLTDDKTGGWFKGESPEGFKLTNQQYPFNQYIIHPKETMVDITTVYSRYSQPYKKKKSVPIDNLNQYLVEYPEIMVGSEKRGVTLDLESVQIKEKEIDRNEVRRKKQKEAQSLTKEIVAELSKENNLIYVDRILDIWIANFRHGTQHNEFMQQWLGSIPNMISEKINALIQLLGEIQENRVVQDLNQVIINIVLEANCSRLFETRKESLSAMSIIHRLTIACEYLEKLRGKDLIFFIGNTGAGKSTAINYFTGVPLFVDNRGPIRTIRINEADTTYESQSAATIGTCVGSSETTYVRGFSVREYLREYWDNSNRIDFENLMLCDCPGFNDSRGMGYDLSASLSISRAIKDARSVKAIVLVIPYRDFFSAKGKAVIDAFEQMEEMFTEKLDGSYSYEIKKSLRLVISHSNDPTKEQNSFESLIRQFYSEKNESNTTNEVILKREKIWEFILKLCQERKVLFADVENMDKQTWLSSCAIQNQQGIDKKKFTEVLDRGTNQRAFADSIHSSLYIWGTLILQRYFDKIPQKIDELQENIDTKEAAISNLNAKNTELKLSIESATQRKKSLEEKYATLVEIRDSQEFDFNSEKNDLLEELREKTKQLNNAEIERKKSEKKTAQQSIIRKKSEQDEQNKKINNKKEELKKINREIRAHVERKSNLSTGRATEELVKSDHYMPGEKLVIHTLKSGSLKLARDEVRELREDDTMSKEEHIVQTFSGITLSYVYIKKDFRIIPESDKREEFYQKQSVLAKNGQYAAVLKGTRAKLSSNPQYAPKGSADGKAIVYTIELTWEAGKEFPWFSIEHTIPKMDINEQAILNEDSEITRKRADAHSKQEEIKELELAKAKHVTAILDLEKREQDLEGEIEQLQNREMRNNIPELIKTYDNMIASQSLEIKTAENDVLKNIQAIEEHQKELPIKQIEKNKLRAEKIRLAVVILNSLNIMQCLESFAIQALDASTDVARSIKRRDNMSEGSLGALRNECEFYIDYYNKKKVDFESSTSDDFTQSLLSFEETREALLSPTEFEVVTDNIELAFNDEARNEILEIEGMQVLHQQKLMEALEKDWSCITNVFESTTLSELQSIAIESCTPPKPQDDVDEISQCASTEEYALNYGCAYKPVSSEGHNFFDSLAEQFQNLNKAQEPNGLQQKIAQTLTSNWPFYRDYMKNYHRFSIAGQEILLVVAHAFNVIVVVLPFTFNDVPKIIRPVNAVDVVFLSYDQRGCFQSLLPIKENKAFQELEQLILSSECLNNEFSAPPDAAISTSITQVKDRVFRGPGSPLLFRKNSKSDSDSSLPNSPVLEDWLTSDTDEHTGPSAKMSPSSV